MYKNIAVFASGSGSNLQAIADACKSGKLNAKVCVVISNNKNAYALQRAKNENIPAYHLTDESEIYDTLRNHETDFIFLCGYLKKIGKSILNAYKIYNIHPALLPKYGGKGMYGINVHKEVIKSGDSETGVTIHRADSEYDTGPIVAQCKVPVLPGDTAETLSARVLKREHTFIVETLAEIIKLH